MPVGIIILFYGLWQRILNVMFSKIISTLLQMIYIFRKVQLLKLFLLSQDNDPKNFVKSYGVTGRGWTLTAMWCKLGSWLGVSK